MVLKGTKEEEHHAKHTDFCTLSDLLLEADVIQTHYVNVNGERKNEHKNNSELDERFFPKTPFVVNERVNDNSNDNNDDDAKTALRKKRKSVLGKEIERKLFESFENLKTDRARDFLTRRRFLETFESGNLISNAFSKQRLSRAFERNCSVRKSARGDGSGDDGAVDFDGFVMCVFECAKAYDVDCEVVAKRIISTAFALERRKMMTRKSNSNSINNTSKVVVGVDDDDYDDDLDDEEEFYEYKDLVSSRTMKKIDALEDRVMNCFEAVFCKAANAAAAANNNMSTSNNSINEREFIKICSACALIGNNLSKTDALDVAVDIARSKNRGIDRIGFIRGLRQIAIIHDVPFEDVARRVIAVATTLSTRASP